MSESKIKNLISKFAHDIRNPLTSSKLFLDMLLKGMAGEITPQQLDMITEINNAQDHMLAILDAFREEYSKLN